MKTHETLAQQEFVARQLRRRQMVVLARLFLFLSVLVLWEACARTGAVSYTHLDVYKRQGFRW